MRRAAWRLASWQGVITLVIAAAAGLLGGQSAATSALLGGGIGMICGLYQAMRMFRVSAADDPGRFYRGVWVSEVVKILLTVALFIFAIRVLDPEFGPMIVAYAATFLVYWVALGTGYPWFPPGGVPGMPAEELNTDSPRAKARDGR